MGGWMPPIVVALIGGPLMWFLSRLDKRNSSQHASSLSVLESTKIVLDGVDGKLDILDNRVAILDERIYNHIVSHSQDDSTTQ